MNALYWFDTDEVATDADLDFLAAHEGDAAELEREFWASRYEDEPAYVPGAVELDDEDYLPF